MDNFICVSDFEKAAKEVLDISRWEYIQTGTDDEYTVRNNREAFNRWLIRPRMLRDVSQRDLSVTILGKKLNVPIAVCPMGMQRIFHPEGEVASAKAIASVGGIFTLALFATSSIEEIAAAIPNGRKWLQITVHKDREVTKKLLKRAEDAGFEAIVLTVDAQYLGNKRAVKRHPFKFPEHLRFKNTLPDTVITTLDFDKVHALFSDSVTWEVVKWLKRTTTTTLPIVVKGILTPEDAELCVSNGADAIIVSNHGGRQLDTVNATINILPQIVKAVEGKCEVYIDSGVTKGSDIFKALALGAKMAFIGRAMIYGISAGGEEGGKKVVETLRDELDLTMALSGVKTVNEITSDYVIYEPTQNNTCKL